MSAMYSTLILIAGSVLAMGCYAQAAADHASITSTAARAAVVERNVLTAQAVQSSTVAEQLVTLTTTAEYFSALHLPANQALAQGVVILLPGVGETFDWPIVIGPLRRKLPDAGWHTLSLNLPEPPSAQLTTEKFIADPVPEQIVLEPPLPAAIEPEETELTEETASTAKELDDIEEPGETLIEIEDLAEELTEDTATDTDSAPLAPVAVAPLPIPAYPQRINDFIQAAISYAETLNAKEIVLLGHHERAHWVLNYPAAQTSTSLTPIRLVLIAPRNSHLVDTPYEELIRISSLPIADFYYKGVFAEQQAAQQRLNASRRAALRNYHQVALNADSGTRNVEQEQLFRRVKGWLNKALNAQ